VRGEVHTGFWWEKLKDKHHLENQVLDGKIQLRLIFGAWNVVCVDWIDLVQVRDKWWALVNTVMYCRVA
jgi:hypothetical protein